MLRYESMRDDMENLANDESSQPTGPERRAALEEAQGTALTLPGVTAAQSQDFLYDEAGLPA